MLKVCVSMLEKNSIAQRRSALNGAAFTAPFTATVHAATAESTAQLVIAPLQAEARWSLRMPEREVAKMTVVTGFLLDQPINRFQQQDGRTAARLGPDEWLLLGSEADAELIAGELTDGLKTCHHALVDISHRNVALTVSGPAAADLLNAGCPLDLHRDQFPPGMVTRTLLGKCEILLFRIDDGTNPMTTTYRVECWRSFATYVTAFLNESAREYRAT
jgi:sarcosine oxidase, subunit gamma